MASAAFDAVHAPHPNGSLVLSVRILKLESGEFDLESVQSLFFADIGVQGLEAIGKHCPNLRSLELHNCGLIEIRALGSCTNLRRLVLSNNKIQSLDGLRFLESLQALYLQDNFISTTDGLKELARLRHLDTLFLRNLDKTMPNPVCKIDNYKPAVRAVLPQLTSLDGERWVGARGGGGAAAAAAAAAAVMTGGASEGEAASPADASSGGGGGGRGDGVEVWTQRQQAARGNLYAQCDELDGQIEEQRAAVERDMLEVLSKPWVEDDFFQLERVDDDAYRDSLKRAEGELLECKQLNASSLALIQKITQRITG